MIFKMFQFAIPLATVLAGAQASAVVEGRGSPENERSAPTLLASVPKARDGKPHHIIFPVMGYGGRFIDRTSGRSAAAEDVCVGDAERLSVIVVSSSCRRRNLTASMMD